jgi:phage gp16-like protein
MSDRTLQRQIFAACRELRIDDDTRRELQFALTGKASLATMTDLEMQAVIDGLKARGWKPAPKGGKGKPAAARSDVRYIHVLWGLLAKKGVLTRPGRAGLNLFIRQKFERAWGAVPLDIDLMTDAGQIRDVTEALKAWCRRVGVKTTR